jgi:hypothetical protein
MNVHERKRLERLDRVTTGILAQARIRDTKLQERCARLEQATLEIAEELREMRAALEGIGISLPSPSDVEARISQSSDARSTLPA